jgi:hypothetical protein
MNRRRLLQVVAALTPSSRACGRGFSARPRRRRRPRGVKISEVFHDAGGVYASPDEPYDVV